MCSCSATGTGVLYLIFRPSVDVTSGGQGASPKRRPILHLCTQDFIAALYAFPHYEMQMAQMVYSPRKMSGCCECCGVSDRGLQ